MHWSCSLPKYCINIVLLFLLHQHLNMLGPFTKVKLVKTTLSLSEVCFFYLYPMDLYFHSSLNCYYYFKTSPKGIFKERSAKRETLIHCLPCAPTRDQTSNWGMCSDRNWDHKLLIEGITLQPIELPGQGYVSFFFFHNLI